MSNKTTTTTKTLTLVFFALEVEDEADLLLGMSGGIDGLDAGLEERAPPHVQELREHLVVLAGDVADVGVGEENGHGTMVVRVLIFTHEPQYEYSKNSFIAGAITWLTGRAVTIPQHAHARGAVHVGLASDHVTLASIAPFVRALDADSRFDLRPFDAIGARFELLEHLDALVFPDGSDHAELVAGGMFSEER